MPLIKDGEIAQDPWVRLGEDDALPRDGDVIVSLGRYRDEADAIRTRTGRTGVALANDDDPAELKPYLDDIDLVALHFPAFTDGRAYSQARRLRTQLGYDGELRATGDVLADQAAFLVRVGFDAFEVSGEQPIDTWLKGLRSMTLAYQQGYEGGAATRYSGQGATANT